MGNRADPGIVLMMLGSSCSRCYRVVLSAQEKPLSNSIADQRQ